MPTRRNFILQTGLAATALGLQPYTPFAMTRSPVAPLKLSLAQWSLHRSLEAGRVHAEDFASIARNEYGINAVEYVNSFYSGHGEDEGFWKDMRTRADNEGVRSLLIMVDGEGELGAPTKEERRLAVENHLKWIRASKILGGHSIRVNAFGRGNRDSLKGALTESLGNLADYGKQAGINILIENHGLHTSDAAFIVDIIREVNSPYLGTLPDFGNWCLSVEWGSTQGNTCTEIYDPIKGVGQFLPFARGVSAKSYDFGKDGDQTLIDYPGLLQLVKESGYEGYIGIEYEGMALSEPEGIHATKKLIERIWDGL